MKKAVLFCILSILLISCQNELTINELKINLCNNKLSVFQLDLLPIVKSYSKNGVLFDVNIDVNAINIKGNIKKIREQYFNRSKRFDEETLSLISETQYDYDVNSQLLSIKTKLISDDKEYQSLENIYGANNKLISHTIFKNNMQDKMHYLYNYTYLESGLISSEKEKVNFDSKNINDRKISNENWSTINNYYYDNENRRVKDISKNPYFYDSSVVKYNYNDASVKMPYEIIKFNKSGERISTSDLIYDSVRNILVIRTWATIYISSPKLDNEIVVFFNENCKIKKITEVKDWIKNTKMYSKAEYNEEGDLVNWSEFVYPSSNETDFTYLKDYDSELQFEYQKYFYEYTYDKTGNWIERKEGDKVVKRGIIYR
jgi:hypothetical protein